MPRTQSSGRGTRVAAAVRAVQARRSSVQTSSVWPSARRWLVVAGLLSGAWFAGAACAAADGAEPVTALADSAAVQEGQHSQAGDQGLSDLAASAEGPDSAAADSGSGGAGGNSGGADGDSNADTGAAASGGVQEAAADPVGSAVDSVDSASAAATGADGSAGSATGHDRQRPDDSAAQSGKGGSAAVGRLGDTVAAVSEVGRDAGRTVPISVSHAQTPDPADVVSEAASAAAGNHEGFPGGLGFDGFGPADMDGVVTLPAFDLGQPPNSSATPGPAAASGADSAERKPDAAPAADGQASAHHASSALAGYTGPAGPFGSADDNGGGDAEPHTPAADRADAAAVGSAVNTPQPGGGMCAGYLPAAASAAPAAGSLQCARQALADVPRDLGEQPTFSPD